MSKIPVCLLTERTIGVPDDFLTKSIVGALRVP